MKLTSSRKQFATENALDKVNSPKNKNKTI